MSDKRRRQILKRRKKILRHQNKQSDRKPIMIDLRPCQARELPSHSGFSHQDCYARAFKSCDTNLSKEHYISANILELFDKIDSEKIPFLKGLNKEINPLALNARVLCERHNTFLSPLDDMAGQLFRFLLNFQQNDWKTMIVSGNEFEKWMGKALLGYLATGKVSHNGRSFTDKDVKPELLQYIFADMPLPSGWGLYSIHRVGDKMCIQKQVGIVPMFLNDQVMGIKLNFPGLELLLCLETKEKAFKSHHPDYPHLMHRLKVINNPQPGYNKTLTFAWD